jgi:hypothetical protein
VNVTHTRTKVRAHMALNVYYEVEGVDPLPHWHKGTWLPTHVHLELDASEDFGERFPKPVDFNTLSLLGNPRPVSGITVHGVKIKQDGTPGEAKATEHYYGFQGLPPWLEEIVQEIIKGLA